MVAVERWGVVKELETLGNSGEGVLKASCCPKQRAGAKARAAV